MGWKILYMLFVRKTVLYFKCQIRSSNCQNSPYLKIDGFGKPPFARIFARFHEYLMIWVLKALSNFSPPKSRKA